MAQPIKLAFWRPGARPHVVFENWLEATDTQIAKGPSAESPQDRAAWLERYRARNPLLNSGELTQAYRQYARNYLQECDRTAFRIHIEQDREPNWRLEELPTEKLYPNIEIHRGRRECAANLEIGALRIHHGHVILSGCRIGSLELLSGSITLTLNDCWIGRLTIDDNVVFGDSSIKGGGILSIATPRPGSKIFSGYLDVDRNTYVPTKPTLRMPTPNAYLFLRHQLAEVGNTEAASFFARAEHYFNYRREPGAARLVSFLYWVTSDYGTSVTWPLLWSLGLIAAGTAFGFAVGPVLDPDFVKHATDPATADLLRTTWYAAFLDDGWLGRFSRAIAAAWGAAVNPFSIFGDRGVVLMPSWWSNLILKLIGAFTTLSIAMFFLAIRRRFRLS